MKVLFASTILSLETFLFTWLILGENPMPSGDVISVLPYLFLVFPGIELLKAFGMSKMATKVIALIPLGMVQVAIFSMVHSSVMPTIAKSLLGFLMVCLILLIKAQSGCFLATRKDLVPLLLVGAVIAALLLAHGHLKLGLAQANFTLTFVALFAIGRSLPKATWMIGTLLHLQLACVFGSFLFTTLILIVISLPMLSCKRLRPSLGKWPANLNPVVSAGIAALIFASCNLQPSHKKGLNLEGPNEPEKSSLSEQTPLNQSEAQIEADTPEHRQGLRIHFLNGHLLKNLAKMAEIRVSLLSTDEAYVAYIPESAQVIAEPLREGYLTMEFDIPGSRFLSVTFLSASAQILGSAELAFDYDTAGKQINIPVMIEIDPNLEIKVRLDLGFRFKYQGALIEKTTYQRHIKPLVMKHCQPCHNAANFGVPGNTFGTVDYESWPFRFPDDPLYTFEDMVRASRDLMNPGAERMPPNGGPVPPVSRSDIGLFNQWIATGMPVQPELLDSVKSLLGQVELRLHNLSQGTVTELGRSELTLTVESPSHLDLKLEDLNLSFNYELELIAWNLAQEHVLKRTRLPLDLNHPSALIDIELAE